jgi:hypothetical protein
MTCIVILTAGLLTTGPLTAEQQPGAALKIVVIEGEGAINIIQQKTAVAPVIEVRDRNDQPVAGATVNFIVRTGRATFGGARTLTVTTNAAGRAAAAGFAPGGTGALQIGATASFQGQTAAAVTIAQTNVLTAAEAAAVSSAGASAGGSGGGGSAAGGGGAGAGGGGGISATTIGIVGGAVAAGVVVAKQTGAGDSDSGTLFVGEFSGPMPETDTPGPGFNNPPCTRINQQTGRIRVTLDQLEGSITGSVQIEGDIIVTPGTCPVVDGNRDARDRFGLGDGRISGTADGLTMTGNSSNNYTNAQGGGINSWDFTFNGRLSGGQITGSLTLLRTTTFASPQYRSSSRGTVTYDVVLREER